MVETMADDFEAFIAPPTLQYPLLSACFTNLATAEGFISFETLHLHLESNQKTPA